MRGRNFFDQHEHAFRGWRPPTPPGGWGGAWGGGWAGGPHGPGHHGHGRGRGRRPGNVRAALLALLVERPMHGYEMIQEIDQRTGGVWRPSPGSVYPTLQLLEDEGLIASDQSGGRKRFTLTDQGRTEAAEAAEHAPWREFSEETVASGHDTREAIFGIMNALRQIGMSGNQEQWRRAVEVLTDTKRRLYAILAEGE